MLLLGRRLVQFSERLLAREDWRPPFERGALVDDIFMKAADLLLVRVAEVLAQNILLAPDQVLRRG